MMSHQTNDCKQTEAEVPESSPHFGNALLGADYLGDQIINIFLAIV